MYSPTEHERTFCGQQSACWSCVCSWLTDNWSFSRSSCWEGRAVPGVLFRSLNRTFDSSNRTVRRNRFAEPNRCFSEPSLRPPDLARLGASASRSLLPLLLLDPSDGGFGGGGGQHEHVGVVGENRDAAHGPQGEDLHPSPLEKERTRRLSHPRGCAVVDLAGSAASP
ncbi:hypothetical protein MHYP_G00253710 [Metynnis hypsauchen]